MHKDLEKQTRCPSCGTMVDRFKMGITVDMLDDSTWDLKKCIESLAINLKLKKADQIVDECQRLLESGLEHGYLSKQEIDARKIIHEYNKTYRHI